MASIWVAPLAALALAGCAATAANRDALNMRGQPIDAAISRYGYPADERLIAGRHVYTWTRVNQLLTCRLVVEVDTAGRIVNHTLDGQMGACNLF